MDFRFSNSVAFLIAVTFIFGISSIVSNSPLQAQKTDWVKQPMEQETTVVLAVESGPQSKMFKSYKEQLKNQLNINLEVASHPFSEQFQIEYLDLSTRRGQYDLISYWPIYMADFKPFITPLKEVAPGGSDQVRKDLELDGVHEAYLWTFQWEGDVYASQYDGDIKLLHYRRDLANDPEVHERFEDKYGYDFDVQNLTWKQYYDVAEFFTRPEEDFYGTAEIAGFLAYFTFMDRYVGMGGHLFSYEDMSPFYPSKDKCIRAVEHGINTFKNVSPPEAQSFEFSDARNQIIKENRVMFVPQWPDVWAWTGDPEVSNAVGKVSVAQMPGFKRDGEVIHRPDMNGGRVLSINDATPPKVKEAAYKVMAFFQDKERTSELVTNNDTWLDPWRKSHLRPEIWSHLCKENPERCENYVNVIDESTANGYPGLQIRGTGQYHETIERWAKKAWSGQTTARETCNGIEKEFNQITNRLGRENQLKQWRRYVDDVLKPQGLWP